MVRPVTFSTRFLARSKEYQIGPNVPKVRWRRQIRIRSLIQKRPVFLPWIARGTVALSLTYVIALLCDCRQLNERRGGGCGGTVLRKFRRDGLSTGSMSLSGSLIVFSPTFARRHIVIVSDCVLSVEAIRVPIALNLVQMKTTAL
jgi:hypothetical protein